MAITQNTFNGNGSNLGPFTFTFEWISTLDIKVSVDGVVKTAGTHYNIVTPINYTTKTGGSILFTSGNAPTAGTGNVRIYRDTDDSELVATFSSGSAIRAADLNSNFIQNLYTTQEVKARYLDRQSGEMDAAYVPLTSTDVVTKGYMETNYGIIDEVGFTRWRQVATGGQTVFSGAGTYGNNLSFVPNREQVYLNGVLQQINADYTSATDGLSITFGTGLTVGDIVDVVCINNLVQNTTTNSANFDFVQAGTGAVTRSVQSKLSDVVSVKDFGAVGDGVTDDTAAIQAAIAATSSSGASAFFPQGTYILSNSTWPSSFNIKGAGIGRSIIKWKQASAETNLINLSGLVNASISGITFDSNRQNQSDSTGYYGAIGGVLSDEARICVNGCEFLNGRIADIVFLGPTGSNQFASLDIHRCKFTDGLVGTSTRAAQAVSVSEGIRLRVVDCDFRQPTGPASYGRGGVVMQRPAGSTSLAFGQFEAIGNSFENFGRGTDNVLGCLYVYSGSEATTIIGNRFRNSYGTAITVKADCGCTAISNNNINTHYSSTTAAIALFNQADTYTSSTGRSAAVSGNVIYNPEQTGIFVDGERSSLTDFNNVIIQGNICDGGLRGIHFRNVNAISIQDNTVANTTGVGIFGEDGADSVVLAGNTITSGLVGIDINGSTSTAQFRVSSNSINSLTSTAIRLRSSVQSFLITGNQISNCTTAFDTRGASTLSTITGNTGTGLTVVWEKSGTYSELQFDNNSFNANLAFSTRNLTIASDAVTVFADWHTVDTEGAAATDDLSTINGGYEGRRLILFAGSNTRDVVLKDGIGNLRLAGDFTLTHSDDCIDLIFKGGVWFEVSRSDNAA